MTRLLCTPTRSRAPHALCSGPASSPSPSLLLPQSPACARLPRQAFPPPTRDLGTLSSQLHPHGSDAASLHHARYAHPTLHHGHRGSSRSSVFPKFTSLFIDHRAPKPSVSRGEGPHLTCSRHGLSAQHGGRGRENAPPEIPKVINEVGI